MKSYCSPWKDKREIELERFLGTRSSGNYLERLGTECGVLSLDDLIDIDPVDLADGLEIKLAKAKSLVKHAKLYNKPKKEKITFNFHCAQCRTLLVSSDNVLCVLTEEPTTVALCSEVTNVELSRYHKIRNTGEYVQHVHCIECNQQVGFKAKDIGGAKWQMTICYSTKLGGIRYFSDTMVASFK
jgi:hypothetical protein